MSDQKSKHLIHSVGLGNFGLNSDFGVGYNWFGYFCQR